MKAVFKSTGGKDPAKDLAQTFAPGSFIFNEGELGTEMFIIQEGEVHICKRLAGESHVLSRLEKGDFFGEMALLDSAPRSADAIAHTEVRILSINGSKFDDMIRKTPEIAIRIIRKYAKRLREANHLLETLVGQKIEPDHVTNDPAPLPTVSSDARQHRLVDVATGNAFFLSQGDESTVGRADPVTGILPDIDLTSVDNTRSVSRRHAKIVKIDGSFAMLEEVGTVNGTFVNGERIPTGVPVPVKHNDEVKIGLIQMRILFET